MAARPPAQPTAILRGHRAQVHSAVFMRLDQTVASGATMTADTRLATGDSDGYVVLWDLAIVRARAVWRAHKNSILGMAAWDDDRQLVTHGRDHRLVVWQVGVADEARLSTVLPLDDESAASSRPTSAKASGETASRPQPWMVHVLEVNTMNFCAFAWSGLVGSVAAVEAASVSAVGEPSSTDVAVATDAPAPRERLLAVPNTLTLEAADLYHLPSQRRINTIRLGTKEGMIMAMALFYASAPPAAPETLVLIAAFENGVVVLATLAHGADGPATILYRAQPHSQPILSLDVAPDRSYFLTSAADAVIAKHPIRVPAATRDMQQQSKQVSTEASQTEFAPPSSAPPPRKPVSLLSAALAKDAAAPPSSALPRVPKPPPRASAPVEIETQPLATTDTKHAGQQGLRIRDDGRLYATAGWDARVRVYSAQTMKEVAVLKWHQTGCFAVAFAPVTRADADGDAAPLATPTQEKDTADTRLVSRPNARREISVKERRLRHAVTAHWLAAGSKDGKISLWDIF
ncbi:Astra associated protein 1 Asa1 [Sporothrix curviconia]|uniref:ASTRA-associated protein 1 n=1 Tax=Sporothrix curviconia TaxID=1260050 RepID=A0ABP0ARM7_9PEZI